jgi:hypothetical protein
MPPSDQNYHRNQRSDWTTVVNSKILIADYIYHDSTYTANNRSTTFECSNDCVGRTTQITVRKVGFHYQWPTNCFCVVSFLNNSCRTTVAASYRMYFFTDLSSWMNFDVIAWSRTHFPLQFSSHCLSANLAEADMVIVEQQIFTTKFNCRRPTECPTV